MFEEDTSALVGEAIALVKGVLTDGLSWVIMFCTTF